MSRILTFRREAVKDANDAFKWYEEQRVGLGWEYNAELKAALERIEKNPQLPRVFYRKARKIKLRRFPYLVVYLLTAEEIMVVAVIHGSRNPGILRRRIK